MDLIVKNGTLITACEKYQADIGIADGRIVCIGKFPEGLEKSRETVDATGKYVFPGIIDAHVHFQLPMAGTVSNDDFENGTKAAACGGVTTIIDYATQEKGKRLIPSIHARRKEADGKVCIDYSLHAGVTDWDLARSEMEELFSGGISSLKMFMAYKDRGLMSDDTALFEALEESQRRGGVVSVHAESSPVLDFLVQRYHGQKEKYGLRAHSLSRPDILEVEAIERASRWAELSGGTLYIVHTSTGEGVKVARKARKRGARVYVETCPQYLLLDDSVFEREDGHLFTSCPQVKSKKNQEMLWHSLVQDEIHVLATDTCTFTREQKDRWQGDFTRLPFGMPGVETLLPLMYTAGVGSGRISVNKLVRLLCYQPAKIYGLYPQKGTIAIGSDADLTIFDPQREVTLDYRNLQTHCDWSPYQGMKLKGFPFLTLSRGKIVAKEGKFTGDPGHGRFVPRSRCQHLD